MFSRRPATQPLRTTPSAKSSTWWKLFITGTVFIYPILLVVTLQPPLNRAERWLPFSLRSRLSADYSLDTPAGSVPQVDSGVIQDALADLQILTPDVPVPMNDPLRTPLLSVTPEHPRLQVPTEAFATQAVVIPLQSATPLPSITPTPARTATITSSPTSSATVLWEPPASPTTVSTESHPRATKTQPPTETQPPAPTATPPALTPAPTRTSPPTPRPSDTPLPYP